VRATRTTPWANYHTTPSDLPPLTVTVRATDSLSLGEGYLFLAPYERRIGGTPYSAYVLIVDDWGELVYYQAIGNSGEDFKIQPGNLLSFTNDWRVGHRLLNQHYEDVGPVQAVGYRADFHDFQILPNGHKLLLIYEERAIDMSQLHPDGNPQATVVGCRIQEQDAGVAVVFSWSSFDHIPITDTVKDLSAERLDYMHCNAIEPDWDGHLLLSSRDIDEVTKINRHTGQVMWRLGGKGNQFEFVNGIGAEDVAFAGQHDVRRVSTDTITLFDNRLRASNYSRAVAYRLDEVTKVATLTWEYRHTPDIFSLIMANAQRLPNGNTLIGWGSGQPAITEVGPAGDLRLQVELPPSMQNYRAFRFPWVGLPRTEPTLLVERTPPTVTLRYSWNGATEVAAWRIYGGAEPPLETWLKTEVKTGFETTTVFTDVPSEYQFRVVPVDEQGLPLIGSLRAVYLPLVWR
jgi:hypothetical protein